MNSEIMGPSTTNGISIPEIPFDASLRHGDWFETVDGKRVEVNPMSRDAATLASKIFGRLVSFVNPRNLGQIYFETKITLALKRQRNRIPDLMYVSYATCPKDQPAGPEDAWEITPDICVEVISSTDQSNSVLERVYEYLEAGIKLVWVVHPRWNRIDVFDTPDRVRVLTRNDTLTGNGVLPGFELPLAELFPVTT